ncbi:MAG: M20/M25/M40 family metallo-hydrolase, partial [Chloroflexota bacterium]|nr:M20/M25/M40 family metallo-hydrolase [Chloroflexota bacterium]
KHIDERGFIRVQNVGGFDARTLVMQRVLVQGKQDYVGLMCPVSKPLHLTTREEREKGHKLEDMFIDLMLPVEEVQANVSIGDPITLLREPHFSDRAVATHYLDDRVGVYVMLEALRQAQGTQVEIQAVVSVQEEVGLRGAMTGAFGVEPDIGIAIDVTVAGDLPGAERSEWVSPLGEGAAISIMDADSISDARLIARFRELATQHDIKHQLEVRGSGGTDAGAMQLSRSGAPVITVSIPIRYIHSVNEMALISDIEATVSLMARFLETAHEVQLEW